MSGHGTKERGQLMGNGKLWGGGDEVRAGRRGREGLQASVTIFKEELGTSLVLQWSRTPLAMQGTWIPSLVGELRFHMQRGSCAITSLFSTMAHPHDVTKIWSAAWKTWHSQTNIFF